MTQFGLSSFSILSKSAAAYFFGFAPLGATKRAAVSRRPGLVSQMPTSSLPSLNVFVMAVRYMRERDPTPTFTYLRRGAAAVAMAESPTAAAPVAFSMARRSKVRSVIDESPEECWPKSADDAGCARE